MTTAIHVIDPHADTVIVLKNSHVEFAVWDDGGDQYDIREVDTESVASEAIDDFAEEDQEVHYKVSSHHLRLASPRFASMLLKRKWQEGKPDAKDGLYHIATEHWDEEALLILLNMLHLHTRDILRRVSLELLAKIAVLVDYYECGEAIELFTKRWINQLRRLEPILQKRGRSLTLWMCIAWVFKLSDDFTEATDQAVHSSDREKWQTLGLPIMDFTPSIDQARINLMDQMITDLHELLRSYRSPDYKCPNSEKSFECRNILYGTLAIKMDSLSLSDPRPTAPFPGLSIDDVSWELQEIRNPVWYDSRSGPDGKPPRKHRCNLRDKVHDTCQRTVRSIRGLRLEDFGRA